MDNSNIYVNIDYYTYLLGNSIKNRDFKTAKNIIHNLNDFIDSNERNIIRKGCVVHLYGNNEAYIFPFLSRTNEKFYLDYLKYLEKFEERSDYIYRNIDKYTNSKNETVFITIYIISHKESYKNSMRFGLTKLKPNTDNFILNKIWRALYSNQII